MALVAVNAVVDVPTNVGMTEIRCIIVAMATGALEHRVVTRIRMAGRANTIRIPMVRREVGVVERRPCPCSGGMACVASRREASGCVVWIGGPLVVRIVATVTVGRQCRVVVIHVALRAGHIGCVITR